MTSIIKGQSAIEYLMTYGWMLLVVALVGGLLFALFQDQELESNSVEGFENEDIEIGEISNNEDSGGVDLEVVSRDSDDFTEVKVCLGNRTRSRCKTINSLNSLESAVLSFSDLQYSEEPYEYDLNITYGSGNFKEVIEGTITLNAVFNSPEQNEKDIQNNWLKLKESGDNVTGTISPGDKVELGVKVNSSSQGEAWLATNESGKWENKTGIYLKEFSGQDDLEWVNFTWSNNSLTDATLGWKILANNSDGIAKSTGEKSLRLGSSVRSVEIIDSFEDQDMDEYVNASESETKKFFNITDEHSSEGDYAINISTTISPSLGIDLITNNRSNYEYQQDNLDYYVSRGDTFAVDIMIPSRYDHYRAAVGFGVAYNGGLYLNNGLNSVNIFGNNTNDGIQTISYSDTDGDDSIVEVKEMNISTRRIDSIPRDKWLELRVEYDVDGNREVNLSLFNDGNLIDSTFNYSYTGIEEGSMYLGGMTASCEQIITCDQKGGVYFDNWRRIK
jgi:hypothetical protein